MEDVDYELGVRFHPTEEELIQYASLRVTKGSWVGEKFFKECDLYSIEPQVLFRDDFCGGESRTVYVFTRLKKKTKNGKRIDRTVAGGKGTWKGKEKPVTVRNRKNRVVGWRRGFRYEPRDPGSDEYPGQYLMKEYTLPDSVLLHAQFKDYVLCKIKKREPKMEDDNGLDESLWNLESHTQSMTMCPSTPSLATDPHYDDLINTVVAGSSSITTEHVMTNCDYSNDNNNVLHYNTTQFVEESLNRSNLDHDHLDAEDGDLAFAALLEEDLMKSEGQQHDDSAMNDNDNEYNTSHTTQSVFEGLTMSDLDNELGAFFQEELKRGGGTQYDPDLYFSLEDIYPQQPSDAPATN